MNPLGITACGVTTFKEYVPPLRVYVHSDGLREVYHGQQRQAIQHVQEIFCSEPSGAYSFVIALVWGKTTPLVTPRRAIDFFKYYNYGDWPGNPTIDHFSTLDGAIRKQEEIICGDGAIILGEEEKHRRRTKTIEEYLSTVPPTLSFIPRID